MSGHVTMTKPEPTATAKIYLRALSKTVQSRQTFKIKQITLFRTLVLELSYKKNAFIQVP